MKNNPTNRIVVHSNLLKTILNLNQRYIYPKLIKISIYRRYYENGAVFPMWLSLPKAKQILNELNKLLVEKGELKLVLFVA